MASGRVPNTHRIFFFVVELPNYPPSLGNDVDANPMLGGVILRLLRAVRVEVLVRVRPQVLLQGGHRP